MHRMIGLWCGVILCGMASIANAQATPCSDSTYLTLKRRNVDSLSSREYEMFRDRDKACLSSMSRSDTSAVQVQQANVSPAEESMQLAAGQAAGRSAADSHGTGGWFAGGLGSGFVLGLIGTALIYIAASNSSSDQTIAETASLRDRFPSYIQGYRDSYESAMRSKRKASALAGGLLGTLTIVLLVVGASGQ